VRKSKCTEEDLTRSIAKHIERDANPLQLNKVYWAKRQDKVEITKAKKMIMFIRYYFYYTLFFSMANVSNNDNTVLTFVFCTMRHILLICWALNLHYYMCVYLTIYGTKQQNIYGTMFVRI